MYEVPVETEQQSDDRILEALAFHVERDFHVKDIWFGDITRTNTKAGEAEYGLSLRRPQVGYLSGAIATGA